MDPRRLTTLAKAVGDSLCALIDSGLHRNCPRHETSLDDGLDERTYPDYPLEAALAEVLKENTRLDKDNALLTERCSYLEAAVVFKDAEIRALRVLAAAPIATSEGEQGK